MRRQSLALEMDRRHHREESSLPKSWASAPVRAVLLACGAVALVAVVGGIALQISAASEAQRQAPPPTFYKDVLPILEDHCQSCHRLDESAPMPLLTYEQTKPWAQKIADAVQMKMMPPWFADPCYGHFSNDPSLSEPQIAEISAWAAAGAPAGDPHDAPAPRDWTSGWSRHSPDIVAKMPKEVEIPASGEVEYTYEIVPTRFTEDKWIQTAEVRPRGASTVLQAWVTIVPRAPK